MVKNVEAVIKKRQTHAGPASSGNAEGSRTNGAGRQAWRDRFGDNLQPPQRQPSKYRPKKRKPKVCIDHIDTQKELQFVVDL